MYIGHGNHQRVSAFTSGLIGEEGELLLPLLKEVAELAEMDLFQAALPLRPFTLLYTERGGRVEIYYIYLNELLNWSSTKDHYH